MQNNMQHNMDNSNKLMFVSGFARNKVLSENCVERECRAGTTFSFIFQYRLQKKHAR